MLGNLTCTLLLDNDNDVQTTERRRLAEADAFANVLRFVYFISIRQTKSRTHDNFGEKLSNMGEKTSPLTFASHGPPTYFIFSTLLPVRHHRRRRHLHHFLFFFFLLFTSLWFGAEPTPSLPLFFAAAALAHR